MSGLVVSLLVVAGVIILILGLYAGKLLAQVKLQSDQQQLKLAQRNAEIDKHNLYLIDSIQLISKAVIEQQCELSEAAIRICRLLEKVYAEQDCDYPAAFPSLHQLDSFLADYPTHQGYKALKKQDRMRFDIKRAEQELNLKSAIETECQQLVNFSLDA